MGVARGLVEIHTPEDLAAAGEVLASVSSEAVRVHTLRLTAHTSAAAAQQSTGCSILPGREGLGGALAVVILGPRHIPCHSYACIYVHLSVYPCTTHRAGPALTR
jgi:hypothetical protein